MILREVRNWLPKIMLILSTTLLLNLSVSNVFFPDTLPTLCHAQSLAETNRVTEQFNWLTVESFLRLVQHVVSVLCLVQNFFFLVGVVTRSSARA